MYEVCPESIQHVLWKIETFTEEDTRYKKHCTQDNDASVPFKVGTLGPHTVLPASLPLFKTLYKTLCWKSSSAALSYFPESHRWSEIFSLSKVILVLGKVGICRAPNLGCRGLSHLGDLLFPQKLFTRDVLPEWACCHDEAAHHQLPAAAAVFVLRHLSNDEEHWGSTPY